MAGGQAGGAHLFWVIEKRTGYQYWLHFQKKITFACGLLRIIKAGLISGEDFYHLNILQMSNICPSCSGTCRIEYGLSDNDHQ